MRTIERRLAQLERRGPSEADVPEITVIFIAAGPGRTAGAETGRIVFRPGART